MEERKNRSAIGMFDLFKGLGMILVVYGHSFSTGIVPEYDASSAILINCLVFIIGASLMQAFFVVSGYGFRKRTPVQCLRYQANSFLKPYVYTMVGVTVLHFITRYFMSYSVKTAAIQTWAVTGGFLLALPDTKEVVSSLFYSCGPMWYLIALAIGWIILNYIMAKFPEKYWNLAVGCVTVAGWLIGRGRVSLFCVSQGMIAVLYIYMGYLVKKHKLLFNGWFRKKWFLILLGYICIIGIQLSRKELDNMAHSVWQLGLFSILLDGWMGMVTVYLVLKLNRYSGKITKAIRWIGANSLNIFAVHTVEFHGIPWYRVGERLVDRPVLACTVVFIMRCLFIAIIIVCIYYIKAAKIKSRFKKKEVRTS